jgi:hypothetical protein
VVAAKRKPPVSQTTILSILKGSQPVAGGCSAAETTGQPINNSFDPEGIAANSAIKISFVKGNTSFHQHGNQLFLKRLRAVVLSLICDIQSNLSYTGCTDRENTISLLPIKISHPNHIVNPSRRSLFQFSHEVRDAMGWTKSEGEHGLLSHRLLERNHQVNSRFRQDIHETCRPKIHESEEAGFLCQRRRDNEGSQRSTFFAPVVCDPSGIVFLIRHSPVVFAALQPPANGYDPYRDRSKIVLQDGLIFRWLSLRFNHRLMAMIPIGIELQVGLIRFTFLS